MVRRRAAMLVLCLTCYARPAFASPLLDLLGDDGSQAGLLARVIPGGAGAAYFNPALLVDSVSALTVGFALVSQQIGISLDGRPGTQFAVPEGIENASHANGTRFDNYPLATRLLQEGRAQDALHDALAARPRQAASTGQKTNTYELVGLLFKLFHDRAALGVHALIPNGEFTTMHAFYNDEREQYFSNSLHPELYGDRLTALSLAFGLGVKVTEQLALGVGTTMNLLASVSAGTYVVDTGNLGKILIDNDAKVNVSLSPLFGASYTPSKRWRISASAHAPERLELSTGFTFLLANGVEQASTITFVHDYTPWQLSAGGSYDLLRSGQQSLTLAASVLYGTWSSYRDRHGFEPSPSYAWSNTLSPTVGLRHRYRGLTLLLDGSYVPSPVPLQSGRSNYVDNDRLAGLLGAEYGFVLWGTDLKLGGQLQLHHLVARHQAKIPTPTSPDGENLAPELVKDEAPDDSRVGGKAVDQVEGLQTNNPGWPGFGSDGWLVSATVYVRVAL